jgi:hypothetical protein
MVRVTRELLIASDVEAFPVTILATLSQPATVSHAGTVSLTVFLLHWLGFR